jgi:trans-aconitate methyltransferase
MKNGFIYWHPAIYHFAMRALYGKGLDSRCKIIAGLLPNGVSVVDVCCGDCYIMRFLNGKNIKYLGLDINPNFVKNVQNLGIEAKLFNLKEDKLPQADYVIMQASLYQFMPDHKIVLDKIFSAARKGVVIAESIKNMTLSNNRIISSIAFLGTKVNGVYFSNRFAKDELTKLFKDYGVTVLKESEKEKDLIGLFLKRD